MLLLIFQLHSSYQLLCLLFLLLSSLDLLINFHLLLRVFIFQKLIWSFRNGLRLNIFLFFSEGNLLFGWLVITHLVLRLHRINMSKLRLHGNALGHEVHLWCAIRLLRETRMQLKQWLLRLGSETWIESLRWWYLYGLLEKSRECGICER